MASTTPSLTLLLEFGHGGTQVPVSGKGSALWKHPGCTTGRKTGGCCASPPRLPSRYYPPSSHLPGAEEGGTQVHTAL